MAAKEDYYTVLGVSRTASDKEIATAYRKLAVKYHPDSNRDDEDASRKFKQAAEAYQVLSDPEKRARYDRYGHAGVEGSGAQFTDVEDIFDAFSDIFSGGMFEGFFGGGRRGRRHHRGRDIRAQVTLTLEEAAQGATKTVQFRRRNRCVKCQGSGAAPGSQRTTCRRCGGHGRVVQAAGILRVQTSCPSCGGAGSVVTEPCTACRGSGLTTAKVSRDVAIPAGVEDGMHVPVAGEGEPSPDGGPPGDLYCAVSIKPHELFVREGRHLILRMPITYSQAVLGARLEVPTLDGRHAVEIEAGTQSGDVLRLRGKGMPGVQGQGRGDLLVQTFVEVPSRVSPEEEQLLRQLAELEHVEVTPQRKSFLDKIREYFAPSEPSQQEEDAS
jgi:molecular chaperone DnaJ